MKAGMATLTHGVLIQPLEEPTSDNLNGLAELLDLCHEADLDTRLDTVSTGPAEPGSRHCVVLHLKASGPLEGVTSAARQAATLAIYSDVGVSSAGACAKANKLLEGTVGVLVKPVEVLVRAAFNPDESEEDDQA